MEVCGKRRVDGSSRIHECRKDANRPLGWRFEAVPIDPATVLLCGPPEGQKRLYAFWRAADDDSEGVFDGSGDGDYSPNEPVL